MFMTSTRATEPMIAGDAASPLTPARSTSGPVAKALLLGSALALLAACGDKGGSGGDAPTGQVVARLGGDDITQLEVTAELQGTPVPANVARRDAEKAALQNIITRRMLAEAARERELDKSPQFQMQQRRTDEQLHVQALARDIAAKVTKPASDEIDRFITENPNLFKERKFFILDQIQFLPPKDLKALNLEARKTMADVEAALQAGGVEFRRQPASLDALGANPQFVREVTNLLARSPDELFMFANPLPGSNQPVMLVNQVKETRVMPFTGDRARQFAERYLQNERIQKALAAEVKKQQDAAKAKVAYQEGWGPPANPKTDAKALAGQVPAGPTVPTAAPRPIEGTGTTAPSPGTAPAAMPAPAPAPAN